MKKPNRSIPKEEALEILKTGSYGVVSTVSKQGEPYGIPINYCYSQEENCIFFHCANDGMKLENMEHHNKVSFCVVGYERIIPERYVTNYESVIMSGTAQIIENEKEKIEKLILICEKFAPGVVERREGVIQKFLSAVTICKVSVDELTGKRNSD